jgi:hypothetical protein
MSHPPPAHQFDGPLARELYAQAPDNVLADDCLGWHGLYRNRAYPGGAILHGDHSGFYTAWFTPSNARLILAWADITAAGLTLTLAVIS